MDEKSIDEQLRANYESFVVRPPFAQPEPTPSSPWDLLQPLAMPQQALLGALGAAGAGDEEFQRKARVGEQQLPRVLLPEPNYQSESGAFWDELLRTGFDIVADPLLVTGVGDVASGVRAASVAAKEAQGIAKAGQAFKAFAGEMPSVKLAKGAYGFARGTEPLSLYRGGPTLFAHGAAKEAELAKKAATAVEIAPAPPPSPTPSAEVRPVLAGETLPEGAEVKVLPDGETITRVPPQPAENVPPKVVTPKGERYFANPITEDEFAAPLKSEGPQHPIGIDKPPINTSLKKGDIAAYISEKTGIPIRVGKLGPVPKEVLAKFDQHSEVIRLRVANDIDTIGHELGHALDQQLGLSATNAFDNELIELGKARSMAGYTDDMIREEGVAEFTRLFIKNPEGARAAAPRYFDAFERSLAQAPEKADVVYKVRDMMQELRGLPPNAQVRAHIKTEADMEKVSSLEEVAWRVYRQHVDDGAGWSQMYREKGLKNLPESMDPRQAVAIARGSAGKARAWVHDGIYTLGKDAEGMPVKEYKSPGLLKILEPVKDELKQWEEFATAAHALELEAKGIRTGLNDFPESLANLQQIVDAAPKHYWETLEGIQQWYDAALDELVRTGFLSADAKFNLLYEMREVENPATGDLEMMPFRRYESYIPFRRDMTDVDFIQRGTGLSSMADLTDPFHKIKGSGRDLQSSLELMIKDAYTFAQRAAFQEVGNSIVNLERNVGGLGKWIERLPAETVMREIGMDQIIRSLKERGIDTKAIGLHPSEVVQTYLTQAVPHPSKGIVTFRLNGTPVAYRLAPELMESLHMMNGVGEDSMVTIFKFLNKSLHKGAIEWNPSFGPAAFVKDAFTASIYSKYGLNPMDLAKSLFDTLAWQMGLKKNSLFDMFVAEGVSNSVWSGLHVDDIARELRSVHNRRGVLRAIGEGIQKYNEAFELAPRFAEMKKGLKKGASMREAIAAGRDITLDFRRSGSHTGTTRQTVAFFNAAIQGGDKFVRELKNPSAWFKTAIGITAPTIALHMANRKNPDYWRIPQYERDAYWHIPSGDGFVRIPKPFELGVIFGTGVERLLQWAEGAEPQTMESYAGRVAETFIPDLVPQALNAFYGVVANYDFFRRRPIETEADKAVAPQYRVSPYTSWTSQQIGKLLGPTIGMGPKKIDYFMTQLSGGLYRRATSAGEGLAGQFGAPMGRTMSLTDVPIIGRFVLPKERLRGRIDQFYQELNRLDQKYHTAARLGTEFTQEDAARYEQFKQARDSLSTLLKAQQNILMNPAMDSTEKKTQLNNILENSSRIAEQVLGVKSEPPNTSLVPQNLPTELLHKVNIDVSKAASLTPEIIEEKAEEADLLELSNKELAGMVRDVSSEAGQEARIRSLGQSLGNLSELDDDNLRSELAELSKLNNKQLTVLSTQFVLPPEALTAIGAIKGHRKFRKDTMVEFVIQALGRQSNFEDLLQRDYRERNRRRVSSPMELVR